MIIVGLHKICQILYKYFYIIISLFHLLCVSLSYKNLANLIDSRRGRRFVTIAFFF